MSLPDWCSSLTTEHCGLSADPGSHVLFFAKLRDILKFNFENRTDLVRGQGGKTGDDQTLTLRIPGEGIFLFTAEQRNALCRCLYFDRSCNPSGPAVDAPVTDVPFAGPGTLQIEIDYTRTAAADKITGFRAADRFLQDVLRIWKNSNRGYCYIKNKQKIRKSYKILALSVFLSLFF